MSLFICIAKKAHVNFPDLHNFNDYLPFPAKKVLSAKTDNVMLVVWQWDSILDDEITRLGDSYAFFQGFTYATMNLKYQLQTKLRRGETIPYSAITTPAVFLYFDHKRFFVSNGMACGELCYYMEDKDFVYCTNKIAMLAALAPISLSPDSLSLMIGRGHVTNNLALFSNIYRLDGGFQYEFNFTNNESTIKTPSLDNGDEMDIPTAYKLLTEYLSSLRLNPEIREIPKRLNLSGGKDSRGVLAIMEKNDLLGNLSISTTGAPYTPDVMAARNVVKSYRNSPIKHVISTPYPSQHGSAGLIRSVISTVYGCDFGLSLMDLGGITASRTVAFGGLAPALKSKRTDASVEQYMCAKSTLEADVAHFINPEAYEANKAALITHWQSIFSHIAPHNIDLIAPLYARDSIFASTVLTGATVAGAAIHPYMDYYITDILMSSPKEMTSLQVVHFIIQSLSEHNLVSQPFCDDTWPSGLKELLQRYNIPFDPRSFSSVPYFFHSSFPTDKSFGSFNWRTMLIAITKDYINKTTKDNSALFHMLNDKFYMTLEKNANDIGYWERYIILSALPACLFIDYGLDLFKPSRHPEIAEDMEKRISNDTTVNAVPCVISSSNYEQCIVTLVEEIRELREDIISIAPKLVDDNSITLDVCVEGNDMLEISFLYTSDANIKNQALIKVKCDEKNVLLNGLTHSDDDFEYCYIDHDVSSGKFIKKLPIPKGVKTINLEICRWINRGNPFYLLTEPHISLS